MADQQQYDARSRPPALGRAGYVLAVLVPLLIAAIGLGILRLEFSGASTGGTSVRVPTSDWLPGQATGASAIQGVLHVDDDHCPYLVGDAGQEVWPVWPAGYEGELDGERFTLIDGAEHDVAHNGDRIAMTGEYRPASAYAGKPCLPGDGQVAVVQSQVSVRQ